MNLENLKINLGRIINRKNIRYFDVVPKNEINFLYFPCIIIANSESDLPGAHWCLFMAYSCNEIYFFDSFGQHPSHYGFPEMNCVLENRKQIQSSTSNICSLYVLMYAYFKTRNYPMHKFFNRFSDNHIKNDRIVLDFIHKL